MPRRVLLFTMILTIQFLLSCQSQDVNSVEKNRNVLPKAVDMPSGMLMTIPSSCYSIAVLYTNGSANTIEIPISHDPVSKPTVTYRLTDNSVYDSNKRLLAINTYQYPDVEGTQYGIFEINEYYRIEVERYFSVEAEHYFSDSVAEEVEKFGVDAVLENPLIFL